MEKKKKQRQDGVEGNRVRIDVVGGSDYPKTLLLIELCFCSSKIRRERRISKFPSASKHVFPQDVSFCFCNDFLYKSFFENTSCCYMEEPEFVNIYRNICKIIAGKDTIVDFSK